MPQDILNQGIAFILFLQNLGDWLIGPMNFFTFFGNQEFFFLILPAFYWCIDSRLGMRLAVALLLSNGLNSVLKTTFHDPRPYWLDERVRLLTNPETSFGIPSGHAQNSVVIWGTLAAYLQRWWGWVIAVAMIFLISLSRMYLGVHFPTDVLGGLVLGVLTLVLVLYLEGPVIAWLETRRQGEQVGLMFAISLVFILAGAWLSSTVSASWQIPRQWVETAARQAPNHPITPLSIEGTIITAGVFFGLTSGFIWLNAYGGLNARGPWVKRLGRYLIGLVGVLILWQGLGILFSLLAAEETLPGYILRYIRYSLIGAWISMLGPLLFIRLGLAESRVQLKPSLES
jgi:membrane-associated phospholipid phosphatase